MNYNILKKIVVLVFLLSIFYGCAKTQEEKELKISDNNVSIRIEGAVYPSEKRDIISTASGKIKKLHIKFGDKIKKGDLIYVLDKELIDLDIENKRMEINSLNQIKNDLITNYKKHKNSADINLAAIELKKIALLKSKGYIRNFEENIYKKNYINAINSKREKDAGNYEKIKNLNFAISTKKVELKKLLYQLKHINGYSPIDGFIADIKVKKGEFISTDKKICTIVNIDKVIVKAGFATGLLPFIHINKKVNVDFITTPSYKITSKIKQIAPIINPAFDNMTLDIMVSNKHYILQEGTKALVTINLSKDGQERVRKYFLHNKNDRVVSIQSKI